jgi:hypothetical protein
VRVHAQKKNQRPQQASPNLTRSSSVRLQAKLRVNAPGDICEQEADGVAAQIASMPELQLQQPPAGGNGQHTDKLPQTQSLQENEVGEIEASSLVPEALRSSGRPLDSSTRAFMEPRFGHDFSRIRVHTDPTAADSARALQANAFAVGDDIVFGEGQFVPGTSRGRRLLAHELTHCLQHRAGRVGAAGVVQRDDKTEQEVKGVKSQNVQLREGAVETAETQLDKRVQKRKAEIEGLLNELGPTPRSEKAEARAKALEKDLAKDLATIIKEPDSAPVNKALRKDIIESAKSVDAQKLKLKTAQDQWSKYDAIFAGDKVAAALGTQTLRAAELKALVAQESGDLTKNDPRGDIAGIAQLGTAEEKRGGGKPGDRKVPEKALIIVAKIISTYAGELDKALSAKPAGLERKKFIMAAYNSGVNAIVTAQGEAIKMKRDGKTWQSLIEGGKDSPLYKAIVATYPKGTDYAKTYKEKSEYPGLILGRLP